VSSDTLEQAALKVLQEGDPWLKAQYGDLAATLWLQGAMRSPYDAEGPLLAVPSRPARLDIVSHYLPLWSLFLMRLPNWTSPSFTAITYGFASALILNEISLIGQLVSRQMDATIMALFSWT